jgi:hypothetical protein
LIEIHASRIERREAYEMKTQHSGKINRFKLQVTIHNSQEVFMKGFILLSTAIIVVVLIAGLSGCQKEQPLEPSRSTVAGVVTFDPSTGKGFVGKGDVQTALGLNNAKMQTLANTQGGVTFTYVHTDIYNVVEAWATGNVDNPVSLNAHQISVTTTVVVNDEVVHANRTNPNSDVTGFNLTGLGTQTTDGTIPEKSPTVTFVTFTWSEEVWDGTYDTVPNPNYNGHNSPTIQVKHYVTVTHETDQLPVDENGNLYTEGNNKAILSVDLVDSSGGFYVNGVLLQSY